MKKTELQKVRILLVDDTPTNLAVLSESIQDQGWTTLFATDGETAIEQAEYAQPDLILLDVMMPGIDGFETCHRLKSNKLTAGIPIIFMTALSESTDKVKGLQLGAVDYITKPFKQEEVVTRVGMQLRLHRMTQQLEYNNELLNQKVAEQAQTQAQLQQLTQDLEARVQMRTAELSQALENLKQTQMHLVQSEKMSSLGQLVAGVAHEINNPVNFIHANIAPMSEYTHDLLDLVELYQQEYPAPTLTIQDCIEDMDLEFVKEDSPKILTSMQVGTERIRQIVGSLKNFSRLDEADCKEADIHAGINSTLLILENRIKATSERPAIQIEKDYGDLPLVNCYPGQLNQVFMNILANALDALDQRDRDRSLEAIKQHPSVIKVQTQRVGSDRVVIRIEDNGPGISEQLQQRIFDPFFTTKPVGKGTRSEEHTSELQSQSTISYAVFCLKKKK